MARYVMAAAHPRIDVTPSPDAPKQSKVRRRGPRSRRQWVLGGAIVLAVVVVLVVLVSGGTSGSGHHKSGKARASVRRASTGPSIAWSFARGLPGAWATDSNLPTIGSDGQALNVTTGGGPLSYQLLSPTERVAPGYYSVVISARIARGGMGVGVLDQRTGRWLAYRGYPGRDQTARVIALPVNVSSSRRVMLVLTNFESSARAGQSKWTIYRAVIRPRQLSTVSSFASSVPPGWSRLGGVVATPSTNSLSVVTGTAQLAYQFESPTYNLQPGAHTVVLTAHLDAGGLGLGLLNANTDTWLTYHNFSASHTHATNLSIGVTLPSSQGVRVVLANFGTSDAPRSRWRLVSVAVR